jgi:hypothetical protein
MGSGGGGGNFLAPPVIYVQLHLLRVGWRNFFSSYVVVSVFWLWCEIGYCAIVSVFWLWRKIG